jgi:hypothetical protein
VQGPPPRDLIVYLGRGDGATAQKGTDVDNLAGVLATLQCFTQLNAHLGLALRHVNPAALSIAEMVAVMSRARVVVGVHGGQARTLLSVCTRGFGLVFQRAWRAAERFHPTRRERMGLAPPCSHGKNYLASALGALEARHARCPLCAPGTAMKKLRIV